MTETIFQVKCKGRDFQRQEVLDKAVDVNVNIHKSLDSNIISCINDCRYNFGSIHGTHGEFCSASSDHKVICPFSLDIPYTIDSFLRLYEKK